MSCFFRVSKQQRGRLGDHGGLLFSQQRRSAVSVSWESPPWGRRSSRFCAEPLTEQQHQSNHCDLVLLPKKVGEPRESAWSNWSTLHNKSQEVKRTRFLVDFPISFDPQQFSRFFFYKELPKLSNLFNFSTWPLGAQVLSSCSSELGCDSATAISCSCVAICSEGTLRWVVLLRGRLRALTKVGSSVAPNHGIHEPWSVHTRSGRMRPSSRIKHLDWPQVSLADHFVHPKTSWALVPLNSTAVLCGYGYVQPATPQQNSCAWSSCCILWVWRTPNFEDSHHYPPNQRVF